MWQEFFLHSRDFTLCKMYLCFLPSSFLFFFLLLFEGQTRRISWFILLNEPEKSVSHSGFPLFLFFFSPSFSRRNSQRKLMTAAESRNNFFSSNGTSTSPFNFPCTFSPDYTFNLSFYDTSRFLRIPDPEGNQRDRQFSV